VECSFKRVDGRDDTSVKGECHLLVIHVLALKKGKTNRMNMKVNSCAYIIIWWTNGNVILIGEVSGRNFRRNANHILLSHNPLH
jgi:hypothetical protein